MVKQYGTIKMDTAKQIINQVRNKYKGQNVSTEVILEEMVNTAMNLSYVKWINVEEKMPESGICILLHSKNWGVAEGTWIEAKGHFIQWRWNAIVNDVTHWCELPELP